MPVTIRQLSYFRALAAQRNFRRAAESCNVSQPALSVQIRELEAALNGPLVERQARDVVLTPFGREVLESAERILAEVAGLEHAARRRGGLTGTLSLGVIPTIAPYFLPEALAALRAEDISLDVEVTETKTETLLARLAEGALDAALVALPIEEEGIEVLPLFEDRFLLAGSAARLAQISGVPSPEGLAESQLLLLEDGHCLTDQALAVCGRGRGNARINMGATSLSTLSRLVAAGFGLTLMPEVAALTELRASPGMRLRRFGAPQPARIVALARRASNHREGWFTELADVLQTVGEGLVEGVRKSPEIAPAEG
ncbi:LysR family transcriptional regulator [Yangia mangrovi]|uniref:LysR family transcriptional regulator n=1 Tax=Alloyangia mangrovi TaxID=1779329 RepID=A0ABT2KTA8_9RHOB|nr:hydrogen peroxide-inducible genes activator [Alloyangia mangrovi]MCT4373505.1 LysR family transcriptional regulator [Alloyangia mangrovi]